MPKPLRRARRPLVVLDFDGTLAPITPRPGDARIGQSTLHKLRELSAIADLAILTGRPGTFARKQLAGVKARVIGSHGNRQIRMGRGMRNLLALAKKRFSGVRGLFVEEKPSGFALHYRNVGKARLGSVKRSMRGFAKGTGATVLAGRKAVEFLPPGAKTKADALDAIVRRNKERHVLYVGDDQSDAKAILRAGVNRNFTGALIRSGEVRAGGVRKISRDGLFRFIARALKAQK